MKTSNKILLGIFLVPVIIFASINVALYAKYKSGHYVAMKTVEEDRLIRQPLKNINHVAVYGLNDFRMVPSDSAKLEIRKEEDSHLHFTIRGDSLIIHGDSVISRPGQEDDIMRSYQSVTLYLPAAATITADNSEVRLEGSKDSLKARSYQFSLVHAASFKIEENNSDDSASHFYFKSLIIQAAHSAGIGLTVDSHIAELQLRLVESDFTDNGASIDKLVIDADKTSPVTLKGDNLKKVNLIKLP